MKRRYTLGTAAAVGLLFVLACITVNIYFPEATVKQAAAEIVDEIRKTDAEKKAPEAAPSCRLSATPGRSRSCPPPTPRKPRTSRRRPSAPSRIR